MSWIANELARLWGSGASWKADAGQHPREAYYLKLDASRARACLDWHPLISLNQALDWIVEWYRAYEAGEDLRRLTRTQIERYEGLLHS